MPDLEFLPAWYISLQRRRLTLKIQIWATVTAAFVGGATLVVQQRDIRVEQSGLNALTNQLKDAAAQQKLLEDQIALRKQLQSRKSVLAAIGQPVDASRLLTTLEALMPKEMSLVSFACTLEESARPASVVKLSAGNDRPLDRPLDRKLKVKIVGLAPSDMDLANFLTAMANVVLFQNVIPNYSSPRTEAGHILREFEVSFWIDLTPIDGEVAWAN